jgi:hypothetical protein
MKVHLLQAGITAFIREEGIQPNDHWYFPHSLVTHFHKAWFALADQPLAERYAQSLRSEISQRWWKRDNYRPKEIMLQLIDTDPELAAIAWKDLGQSTANLEGRLSRFTYYCEQLLHIYRDRHPRAIESYHHQDAAILSLYLAGMFPDSYSLYPGLEVFQSFCKNIGSPDIPKVDDLVRYMKIAAIVKTYLQRDEAFSQLLQLRDMKVHKQPCLPMIVAYEIISFIAAKVPVA